MAPSPWSTCRKVWVGLVLIKCKQLSTQAQSCIPQQLTGTGGHRLPHRRLKIPPHPLGGSVQAKKCSPCIFRVYGRWTGPAKQRGECEISNLKRSNVEFWSCRPQGTKQRPGSSCHSQGTAVSCVESVTIDTTRSKRKAWQHANQSCYKEGGLPKSISPHVAALSQSR